MPIRGAQYAIFDANPPGGKLDVQGHFSARRPAVALATITTALATITTFVMAITERVATAVLTSNAK